MRKARRIGERFLPVLVLGLAVGLLVNLGCGKDEKIVKEYVEVVNNPPVLGEIGAQAVDLGGPLTIVVTASDPDGDVLTFSALNLPPGAVFDAATQTFSWIPEAGVTPAGTYENVIFIVSDDKGMSDSETVTITVSAVGATGAVYTGKYFGIAYNFPSGDGLCSTEEIFDEPNEDLCFWGIPQPGCEEIIPPGFLVQSDGDAIFYMVWLGLPFGFAGTVKNDGSFAMDDTMVIAFLTNDPTTTMDLALAGKISAEKTEIGMDIDFDFEIGVQCKVGFDFMGPGRNHNTTITINGFTSGKDGVNVYAFAPYDIEPTAVGGGTLTGGSAEIQLIPELPDAECFDVVVWLDIGGDIVTCYEENTQFIWEGDLYTTVEVCIVGGSPEVPVELDATDFVPFSP